MGVAYYDERTLTISSGDIVYVPAPSLVHGYLIITDGDDLAEDAAGHDHPGHDALGSGMLEVVDPLE